MNFDKELAVGLELAARAGELQMAGRHRAVGVHLKSDASPVSEVDQACEKLVREAISTAFPADGILGEEEGATRIDAPRVWVVDPIDGTRPYLRGIPTFSFLLSLEIEGDPVLGVIHLPALGETYHGVKGGGAYLNGKPIFVSKIAQLNLAMGSQLGYFEKFGQGDSDGLGRLMRGANYGYGFMDAYTYGSLAAGRVDFSVNLLDKPWDCSAAACIIREAGGAFSDLNGNPTTRAGHMVFSNGILHEQVLAVLKGK